MAVPLVALTTYPAGDDGDVELPVQYVDAIRRAGGRALLVPPGEPDPDGLLDVVDAVVLSGGGDIEPTVWGGPDHETIYMTDRERDESELALARRAIERAVPLLAICRGMQVLNVALGGTLHVHLPDVVGDEISHRAPPRVPVPHAVLVDEGSRLAGIMGATEIEPMSWHHQAVERCGDGLRVVARASDGVVEALELEGHPEVIAVQWHPELSAERDPTQAALFSALVDAARSVRAGGR